MLKANRSLVYQIAKKAASISKAVDEKKSNC